MAKGCRICGIENPHRHKHLKEELWYYHGCNSKEDRDNVIKSEKEEV